MGGAVMVDTGCTAMPNHKARINTGGEDVHQGHAAPDPEDRGEGGATERAKGQGATGGAPLSLGNGTQAQNGGKAPLDRELTSLHRPQRAPPAMPIGMPVGFRSVHQDGFLKFEIPTVLTPPANREDLGTFLAGFWSPTRKNLKFHKKSYR